PAAHTIHHDRVTDFHLLELNFVHSSGARETADENGSVILENPLPAGKDFSSRNFRALGALRGFAVIPGLDFHREGAKHAKKTRRVLVWLRPHDLTRTCNSTRQGFHSCNGFSAH